MRFDLQTLGMRIRSLSTHQVELTLDKPALVLDEAGLETLSDVLDAVSALLGAASENLSEMDVAQAPPPPAPAAAAPRPRAPARKPEAAAASPGDGAARVVAAPEPTPKDAAVAPPTAAAADDSEPQSPVQAGQGPLIIDGEPVKRGPVQTAGRAGPRQGKRRGRPPKAAPDAEALRAAVFDPDAPTKRGPKQAAERAGPRGLTPATSATTQPEATTADAAAPAATDDQGTPSGRGKTKRSQGQITQQLADWLSEHPGPRTLDELTAAATEGGWETADNAIATVKGALGRAAHLFARQPDGTFTLREGAAGSGLPAGKVVRRRRRQP